MHIDTVNEKKHINAFGIKCQPLGRECGVSKKGINVTHCILAPGSETTEHSHREVETFYILKGQGEITAHPQKVKVREGQLVTLLPFKNHVIKNTSLEHDLVLLSQYTDFASVKSPDPQQIIITAPPTPNGNLHLGHLGGPYIVSDIYNRYLELRECKTFFLSGTDDFQNYVAAVSHRKKIKTPLEVTKENRTVITDSLHKAQIEFSEFVHPAENISYQSFVKDFFQLFFDNGLIKLKNRAVFVETKSQKVVLESQIQGDCPHCLKPMSGNCCEECYHVCDVSELKNPRHIEGIAIETKLMQRGFIELDSFRPFLRKFLNAQDNSQQLLDLYEKVFSKIKEFPITYPMNSDVPWGIKNSVKQLDGQAINVWAEMAAGYIYQSKKSSLSFFNKDYSRTTLFCGVDNTFYYACLIPALIHAYDRSVELPYYLHINSFYHLNNEKFSTSRNHAIWANEFLAKEDSDFVRLYFALYRPLNETKNFTVKHYNQTLEVFNLTALDDFIAKMESIKSINKNLIHFNQNNFIQLNDFLIQFERNFSDLNLGFQRNALLITELMRVIQDLKSQTTDVEFLLQMRILGILLKPYMPTRAQQILSHFKMDQVWINDLNEAQFLNEIASFFPQYQNLQQRSAP